MFVRRVLTGQSPAGKSIVVADDQVQPIQVGLMPGAEFHAVWGSDAAQQLPSDGTRPDARTWFPPADGFRFGYVTLPPDTAASPGGMPPDSVLDELRQKLPGMLEVLEPDSPGMHTSDTIDFVHIVSGEIWLELDDGAQRRLRAGDCVIQNGTRHAWRNASTEPCVMAVALIGARRDQGGRFANNPGATQSELSAAKATFGAALVATTGGGMRGVGESAVR